MGTLAHGVQRTALAIDGTVGIALAELTFRLAHGLPGITELARLVPLALRARLSEPVLTELVQQLVEPIPQALLVLAQIAHLPVALPGLTPLTIAPHVLTLPEGLIPQLLLLADDVA